MRRPSPSIVVSIIALVFAAAGTSIAAVNFAKNAGAVDGKSAVGASSSAKRTAGKLVATNSNAKIPARFLDLAALAGYIPGSKQSFAQGIEVVDNATSTPVGLTGAGGVGIVSATCIDQSNTAAKEDPQVTITFGNTSGQTVNFSRSVGNAAAAVSTVLPATQTEFTINNANPFHIYAQVGAAHYIVDGVVRQDGQNTAAGVCAVYGYALVL